MIDLPSRGTPRFPAAMEPLAAQAIERHVRAAGQSANGSMAAVSGAARGGDILFIEACLRIGAPCFVALPFSVEEFLESSVRGVDSGGWEGRFQALWDSLPDDHKEIASCPPGADPYEYCNARLLERAKSLAPKIHLLSLWDMDDSNPLPGGTASFVSRVREAKGEFTAIDARILLSQCLSSGAITKTSEC